MLSLDNYIVREKIPIVNIVYREDTVRDLMNLYKEVLSVTCMPKDVLSTCTVAVEDMKIYRLLTLYNSIKDKGFISCMRDQLALVMREQKSIKSYFTLTEIENNKYQLGWGYHRFVCALLLGLNEIDAFVVKKFDRAKFPLLQRFVEELQKSEYNSFYQTIFTPGGFIRKGRDETQEVLERFDVLGFEQYFGESVLDIACSTGMFAVEAKRQGADEVVGFDVSECAISKAQELSTLLDLKVDFCNRSFKDFYNETSKTDKQYDFVFCNQCIYSIGESGESGESVLTKVCSLTKKILFMYTFVDHQSDLPGYRPVRKKLYKDLKERGFKVVVIREAGHWPAKKNVIAIKDNMYSAYVCWRYPDEAVVLSDIQTSIYEFDRVKKVYKRRVFKQNVEL
ncbi:MAG TPA: class I SAM-dependent methyltransferase [Methanofastidiosum sp.]|nr:class I SAM-dependent methyltransferase [Methanofastidiosum sp.]